MSELPGKKISGSKIGDEAVKKATGKSFSEWLNILDKAGAKKMSHKEIVAHLKKFEGIDPWWQQTVTVHYEIERGLREKHQKPDGYQISRSKTINAPIGSVFAAWNNASYRKKWLKDPDINMTTVNENKSIRGKWMDEKIIIEINFYAKAPDKTQVVVQNNKINTSSKAEELKNYWETALKKLNDLLAG